MPENVTGFGVRRSRSLWITPAGGVAQLGAGAPGGNAGPTPVEVTLADGAIDLALGMDHTLILTGSGEVWACGAGDQGQLGCGSLDSAPVPTRVLLAGPASRVCAGAYYSVVLDTQGGIFTFGQNNAGQLGAGTNDPLQVPTAIRLPGPVSSVAAGYAHSLVLVQIEGEPEGVFALYGWGDNQAGQIGVKEESILLPARVPLSFNPVAIAAGAAHTLALDAEGGLWAWGRGDEGQLGHGVVTGTTAPTLVVGIPPMVGVACGAFTSFAWTELGQLFAFGDNSYGQLGLGDLASRHVPAEVSLPSRVAAVSSGEWHTLVRTEANQLLAWGLTDQGQAGPANASLPHLSAGWVSSPTELPQFT